MASTQITIAEVLASIPELKYEDLVLSRNDFLIREGEVEKNIYLIKSGAIHAFYVSEHEEYTVRFGYEGSVITSIPSFYNQKPSVLYLQAIRKTEVRVFSRSKFFEVMKQNDQLQSMYIYSLEDLAAQQMERELDLLTVSPVERLRRVQQRSPRLFQEIPSKYIASYLRMTPETLSRIQNS